MRFISLSYLLLLFARIPLNRAAKVQRISFTPTFFFEKKEKGKTETDFAFFKSMIMKRLSDNFLFGDVSQCFNEEIPEGLHTLDEQRLIG